MSKQAFQGPEPPFDSERANAAKTGTSAQAPMKQDRKRPSTSF